VLSAQAAQAASLGIALDAFLAQFETFVIGLGMIVGLVGLLGWIGSLLDNSYGSILAGSIRFFLLAGLLGGGTVILGAMGLVTGAVIPV
jgi:hypothetical protein